LRIIRAGITSIEILAVNGRPGSAATTIDHPLLVGCFLLLIDEELRPGSRAGESFCLRMRTRA
jgi:hypothetical protein